jgi:polysaccharide export outer membrane protein
LRLVIGEFDREVPLNISDRLWALVGLLSFFVSCSSSLVLAQDTGVNYQGPEYQVGAEDVLGIYVWREEELQRDVVIVRPDGGISFPLVGSIPAAGKTTRELESQITERIQRYVPDAVVNVTVNQVSGYRIFVIGKVNDPGQKIVGRYIDVLQALTLAGGLNPFADKRDIQIIRRQGEQLVVLPFNYSDIESGRRLEQNVMLESGDVVFVP